jgi:hypothetical protein
MTSPTDLPPLRAFDQNKRTDLQRKFVARGLLAREEARQSGEYYPAEDVLKELSDMLAGNFRCSEQ